MILVVSLLLDGHLLDVVWDFRHQVLWFRGTGELLTILACQIDHDLLWTSIVTFSWSLISASSSVDFFVSHICSWWIDSIFNSVACISHCLKSVLVLIHHHFLHTSSCWGAKIIIICIISLAALSIKIDLCSLNRRFSSFYKLLFKLPWVCVVTAFVIKDQLFLFEVTDGIRSGLEFR